jgi:tripartite-type tricarboxylate transporter receptor subunit TctC
MGICSKMRLAPAIAAAATIGFAAQPSRADDFYAGKSIEILIGSGVGGGYDRYARTVLHHMVKHIPGNPTFVSRNMPGAGSMKTAEYLSTMAPKDGTTIALLQPGALFEPLVNDKLKFRYDPARLEMIGSANSGTRVCVTFHKSQIKTFEDALKTPAMMGGNSPGSSTTDYALMLNYLAGTKFNVVNGYNSTSLVVLAMERSELDGVCGFDTASFASQKPDWYGTKLAHMIVQVGITPDPDLEKMGVPSLWKYASGRKRDVAELILSQQEFHRPFVAPPVTPSAQLAILRAAFDKTMKDPEFLAEAAKQQLDIAPKSGAVVGELIKKVYASPKDLIDEARIALGR